MLEREYGICWSIINIQNLIWTKKLNFLLHVVDRIRCWPVKFDVHMLLYFGDAKVESSWIDREAQNGWLDKGGTTTTFTFN